MNNKIRWAAIFGLCFLLSIIIQQTVLRAFARITLSSNSSFYVVFIFWSLALLPFFATLILNVRGYLYIAEKYNRGILKVGAWIFSVAAALMYLLVLLYVFQYGTHVDTRVTNGLMGLVAVPYVMGLIATALGTYALRNSLGNIVFWSTGVGVLLLLEVILVFFLYLAGKSAPAFASWYVWIPVYESLFVIANTVLFFRAARD